MHSAPDPIAEIVADRERARAACDPFADLCILATGDAGGAPALRPLVLRDVGPQGVGLLVSATSPKWEPLERGCYECLLMWVTIRRQFRIRGGLAAMPDVRIEEYWSQKVHESRLLDLYYAEVQPQSSPVASRARFLDAIDDLRTKHPAPELVPRPALLRGVYLVPERVEAWHGSPDRLHDRRRYARRDGAWVEEVLVP